MPREPELQILPAGDAGKAGWYWRLVGGNGEPMATSETYTDRHDAIRGAEDARRALTAARLVAKAGD